VAELSPKGPIVSGDTRDTALNIESAKWRQIEKAYGLSLPANVRADVVRVTQAFIFFESFERKAEPSEGKSDIRSPRKGCHSVFQ
jgi:hypothetical protein